ncbi:S1C family serine protease [Paludisphaera rhizosphaerae]|uniref:S1C family serine protease n=1 Tax=Paludisphaera rhizosphaerae TaxID=2711216 RepID=UPI0013EBEFA2|nr:trypsin-like peptidase domain-containing protein [Paludisphaera rhizosphaerae]
MDSRDASVQNRLTLWLASGLFFAALVLAITARRVPEPPKPAAKPLDRLLKPSATAKPTPVEAPQAKAAVETPPTIGAAKPASPPSPRPATEVPASTTKSDLAFAGRRRDPEEEEDEALFGAMERLERRMAAGMARARESVVAIEYTASGGAADARGAAVGVVVDGRRGEVLSVGIERPPSEPGAASTIIARDVFGRRHAAHWIAADPETGLTLLQIPGNVLRSIRPASDAPPLGGQVFVVGNPFGLGHSVSRGQVSGLDRSVKIRGLQLNGTIQIQTPLFAGDNGAAVVNYRGQWLGLIRGGLAPAAQPEAGSGAGSGAVAVGSAGSELGFAIPADTALWIASQLHERGRVDRAFLGVRFEPDSTAAEGPEGAGLREVLPDTPAARGSLQAGERIVSFDGRPIHTAHELTERLDLTPAEKFVRLEVIHGDGPRRQQRSVWIQTTRRPEAPRPAAAPPVTAEAEKPKDAAAASPDVVPTSAVVAAPPGPQAVPSPTPDQPQPKHQDGPIPPPRGDELQPPLPRAVAERIEQLERRIEQLEQQRSTTVAAPQPDAP